MSHEQAHLKRRCRNVGRPNGKLGAKRTSLGGTCLSGRSVDWMTEPTLSALAKQRLHLEGEQYRRYQMSDITAGWKRNQTSQEQVDCRLPVSIEQVGSARRGQVVEDHDGLGLPQKFTISTCPWKTCLGSRPGLLRLSGFGTMRACRNRYYCTRWFSI